MNAVKFYSSKDTSGYVSPRPGETKVGETILFTATLAELQATDAPFVILGIPEDIGVRANQGRPGTSLAWPAFLGAFLNTQENRFLNGGRILLLGEIDASEEMRKASNIDTSDPNYHKKLGDLVRVVDEKVSEVVKNIIEAGKFPILIGGGHNNAYGNLKGASGAMGQAVNALNVDAHTDLRTTEYRHSGNGFSFAREEGYLERYAIFGLHQNYTPEYIFKEMDRSRDIRYNLWEDLQFQDIRSEFLKSIKFVNEKPFGLEFDCDAIANFPSSAVSPFGISLQQARELIISAAKEKKCCYLHICEASTLEKFQTGKALSYLVSDFIKSHSL